METFADVIHHLIDVVFHGDLADKAHDIIDRASGTRTPEPAPAAPEPDTAVPDPDPDPAPTPADTPTETADPLTPGA